MALPLPLPAPIKIVTPEGLLYWINITGEGDKYRKYTASLHLQIGSPECNMLKARIDKLWSIYYGGDYRSIGYKVYNNTTLSFTFNTNTTLYNGLPKIVDVYDSGDQQTNKAPKKIKTSSIQDGTIGALAGTMQVYDKGSESRGVSLYLDSVQVIREVQSDGGFKPSKNGVHKAPWWKFNL